MFLPELLRGYTQCAIKLARRVFPRNDSCKLNDLILIKQALQFFEKLIAHIHTRDCHSICIFERELFQV
jgi:hypothetical protein